MLAALLREKIRTCYEQRRIVRLRRTEGLSIGSGVSFEGIPIITISNGGRIIIGDEVVLNSENRGYHVNMHSPVKLFADQPGSAITIGEKTRIHGSCLHAYASIEIGRMCLIAANCQLIDCGGHDLSFSDIDNRINTRGENHPIVIEESVWIGANSIILPGVKIGRGSVIGAGSVVTGEIPPLVVAAGNPARVVKLASSESLKRHFAAASA